MNTDELVKSLADEATRVPRYAIGERIAFGMIGGAAITLAWVAAWLGIRPDLGAALAGFTLWMKLGYTATLGLLAVHMTASLARPDSMRLRTPWLIAVPVSLLAGISIAELVNAPEGTAVALWLGESWQQCPWFVLALSLPMFIGLLWSFRRFAPTRLRAAGAAAGLSAGAWSATLYCLHCPEASATFVLTWYSLGIALATLLGAVLGPRLLRW